MPNRTREDIIQTLNRQHQETVQRREQQRQELRRMMDMPAEQAIQALTGMNTVDNAPVQPATENTAQPTTNTTTTETGDPFNGNQFQIRTGRGGLDRQWTVPQDTNFFGDMPLQQEQDEQEETMTIEDAVRLMEESYSVKFDKKGVIVQKEQEVIVKEPDPVNDNEEVILNYNELADALAREKLIDKYGVDYNEEEHIDEYIQLANAAQVTILNHKRKVNV